MSSSSSVDRRTIKFFSPREIASHASLSSCWLSLHSLVLDVTPLLAANRGSALIEPILRAAGADVTHWFHIRHSRIDLKKQSNENSTKSPNFNASDNDEKHSNERQTHSSATVDEWIAQRIASITLKTAVDADTGLRLPWTPNGRFVHVPPPCEPRSDFLVRAYADGEASASQELPWWRDPQYVIGRLSRRERRVRVVNTLTQQEHVLRVCEEETVGDIRERYLEFNAHAHSYAWKRLGRPLDMSKTLEENGVPDAARELEKVGCNEEYAPAIFLYFVDDLTVA